MTRQHSVATTGNRGLNRRLYPHHIIIPLEHVRIARRHKGRRSRRIKPQYRQNENNSGSKRVDPTQLTQTRAIPAPGWEKRQTTDWESTATLEHEAEPKKRVRNLRLAATSAVGDKPLRLMNQFKTVISVWFVSFNITNIFLANQSEASNQQFCCILSNCGLVRKKNPC